MGMCVCAGAVLQCTFGLVPSVFNVLPVNAAITHMPIANIMDYRPLINILPFGMCSSLANPTVASATSAALGVLTPMPCIPATVMPWTPGSPAVLTAGQPTLNNSSKCMCMWGGAISINSPGQMTIQVP